MQHLFIVGCPRSGTTMLQQAFNRHSQIVIPPETKFFSDFYRRSRHQRRHWARNQADLQLAQAPPDGRAVTGFNAGLNAHVQRRSSSTKSVWQAVVPLGAGIPADTAGSVIRVTSRYRPAGTGCTTLMPRGAARSRLTATLAGSHTVSAVRYEVGSKRLGLKVPEAEDWNLF